MITSCTITGHAGVTALRIPNHELGATKPMAKINRIMHGHSHTPMYYVWAAMRKRCTNPKSPRYYRYGGRGIKVCERWNSFESFAKDMGEKPFGTSLDRIDNDGDYEPSNCRWATKDQQNSNKSSNVIVHHNGRSMILSEWAKELGVKPNTMLARLKRGWSLDQCALPLRNRAAK